MSSNTRNLSFLFTISALAISHGVHNGCVENEPWFCINLGEAWRLDYDTI